MGKRGALNNQGFSLIEVTMGAVLLALVALAATSGFDLLSKTQRKITTSADLRDLMNEVKPILTNSKSCIVEMGSVLSTLGIQPGGLPTLPAGSEVTLKRVTRNPSGYVLGADFVGRGLSYGALKITSATLSKKAQLSQNSYLLTFTLTADRGSASGNSFGYKTVSDTYDFAAQVDQSSNLMSCSGGGSVTTINAIEDSVCNLMPPDPSLNLDVKNWPSVPIDIRPYPSYYFWDSNSQSCVFIYNQIPYSTNDRYVSPSCNPGEVYLGCTILNAGTTASPNCVYNNFSHSGQTRPGCVPPTSASFDAGSRVCKCAYSRNGGYQTTNNEKCAIICGTRRSF